MKCPECGGEIIQRELIGIDTDGDTMKECEDCGQPIGEEEDEQGS